MITVIWLRQDLRIHDNALWQRAASLGVPVLPVYVLPDHWLAPAQTGLDRLAPAKARFLQQSLDALAEQLAVHNMTLWTACANPVTLFTAWHQQQPLQIVTGAAQAPEENAWLVQLRDAGITVICDETQPLFQWQQLPFDDEFPASFSRFRRKVEGKRAPRVAEPLPVPRHWPAMATTPMWPAAMGPYQTAQQVCANRAQYAADSAGHYFDLAGGEPSAQAWLNSYVFEQRYIRHYKATRNQLIGEGFSSRMSAYLAWGCLSPRTLWQQTLAYDAQYGDSEHSYWLRFELLWREFFHWSLRHYGDQYFYYSGIQPQAPARHPPLSSRQQGWWQRWCEADTGIPFVDANLKELLTTGFMSNRGRQNVASFFIHDMGLDWRWGAEFFQHHLLDDDVASNWGNWAYIAGVGHDPRGGRRFSLTKQAHRYDADGAYVRHWLPSLQSLSASQILARHFSEGVSAAPADYPAPMLRLPNSDRAWL